MSTHKTRQELNKATYEKNHKTIETALKNAKKWAGSDYVSVSQLSRKTKLKRDTIYYHLLGDRRPGIPKGKRREGFLQAGVVKKEKGHYVWITCWERSNAIKRSFELITSLIERSEQDVDAENVKGGIFSENIFIFTPFTRANGTKSFTCLYYPLKEFEDHPETFLSDYLGWKDQVQKAELNGLNLELSHSKLSKEDFEEIRETIKKDLIKRDPRLASIPEEAFNAAVEERFFDKPLPAPVAGQIITFRFTRDNKNYVAKLITEDPPLSKRTSE